MEHNCLAVSLANCFSKWVPTKTIFNLTCAFWANNKCIQQSKNKITIKYSTVFQYFCEFSNLCDLA